MEKNPVDGHVDNSIAAIFTMMLPGLGQMLQKRPILGVVFSAGVAGGYIINGWLGLTIHVICILDVAFFGKLSTTVQKSGWFKSISLFVGLFILLLYTCLRTALF